MKIRAKTKDYHLMIKAKAAFREKVELEDLERFAQKNLQGFFKPKTIKKRCVKYLGIPGIPLYEYLKQPITKHEFFSIIGQSLSAARSLWENGFKTENLVSDISYVYINKMTKEIQLIYLPILPNKTQNSFMKLMEDMVYAVNSSEEDTEYLSHFVVFLRSLGPVQLESIEKLENYIAKEERNTAWNYGTNERSQGINSNYRPIDDTIYKKEIEEDSDTEVVNEERCLPPQRGMSMSSDPNEPDYNCFRQGAQSRYEEKSYIMPEEDESTVLSDDEGIEDDERTLLSDDEGIEDDTDETMMFEEDEPEDIDFAAAVQKETSGMPVLFRISTGETIPVTKKVFRLGKEEACVDYAVLDNHAVSRSHADIICRGNQFFVFDLGSKNKSYINNRALPSQYEVEIKNGDILKLANEEFEFRW